VQALRHGALAANLDDVLDALTVGRQLARRLAPARVFAVVDDVVGAELLEDCGLFGRRRGRDDGRPGGFGELFLSARIARSWTVPRGIPATRTN